MALEIDKIREIAERVAASSGLEVVEVELRGGGKARMLRIFIDKPAGRDARRLRQCEPRSEHDTGCRRRDSGVVHAGSFFAGAGPEIDSVQRITSASPEAVIKLTTQQPVNGNRHFEGRLEQFRARAADSGPECREKEAPSGRRRFAKAGNRIEERREGESGSGNLKAGVGRQTSDVGQFRRLPNLEICPRSEVRSPRSVYLWQVSSITRLTR